ncbi:hypothetical protein BKA70DRAFT_1119011 [Coprinopsis sp. MPI-PUGE-AT-0042]|nr:hypothetical protein BKA70DRAFT_1119011 [Coprinopsis sp. MPI-PUGE-AT-0042]
MITLYDLASTRGDACSPNTWKTRLCLTYKGLKHRTHWLEFPEIEATCKELGIPPTSTLPDGQPYYTVPAIVDIPDDDSKPRIAKYLDAAYPETPRIIPEGQEAEEFQAKFTTHFRDIAFVPLAPVFVIHALEWLNPPSKDYIMYDKAKEYGLQTMLDVRPTSKEQEEQIWEKCREGWNTIAREYYAKTDEKSPWLLGDKISFGDFVVVGALTCFNRFFGEDSEEWKKVREWDNGRWGRLYD